MRPSEELRSYVERVQSRLRLVTVLRGAAVLTASALLSTLVLTFLIERLAFSSATLAAIDASCGAASLLPAADDPPPE